MTITIRESCPYTALNRRKNRSCTDDDLCTNCWMDKDVEENREFYAALGDV